MANILKKSTTQKKQRVIFLVAGFFFLKRITLIFDDVAGAKVLPARLYFVDGLEWRCCCCSASGEKSCPHCPIVSLGHRCIVELNGEGFYASHTTETHCSLGPGWPDTYHPLGSYRKVSLYGKQLITLSCSFLAPVFVCVCVWVVVVG